jgi:hypothetical protein
MLISLRLDVSVLYGGDGGCDELTAIGTSSLHAHPEGSFLVLAETE